MAQFKKPSKKATIITAVIIIVLLIIAATGTVMFLRDRGQAEASEIGQEQVATQNENAGSQTTENQPSGESTAPEEQSTTEEVATQGEEETETAGETATEETTQTETQGTTSTGTTTGTTPSEATGTTTATEDIQESTITRTETDLVKVAENHNVWWTPMSINADISSVMDNLEKDDITVEKTAKTKTGSNLVQPEEEITYTIKVTNTSGKALQGIEVKDEIPDNTTYVSAENLDHEVYGEDKTTVEGLVWNLDFAEGEKEKEVSFTVKVNKNVTGTIENVAMANGEESEPVKTAVIKTEKTSVINGDEKITTAKVGDTITYTILVTNTGDIDGTTTVKDKDLEGILSDGKAEMHRGVTIYKNDEVISSDKTANDLINGINGIEVPANGSAKVEFTIKVNKVTGKISNVALVGDETETPTTPDVVDTFAVKIRKEVKDIVRDGASISKDTPVKAGDIINYNIIINNIGSGAGEVSVSDILANTSEQLQLKDEQGNVVNKITLGVGQERTLTASYEVKQDLFDAQEDIKNTVKATYDNGEEEEAKVTTPVEEPNPGLQVTKTATQITRVNGDKVTIDDKTSEEDKKVSEGDKVTYTITVKNTGNVTLENIDVTDELKVEFDGKVVEPNTTLKTISSLAPDATDTIEVVYTVIKADVENTETKSELLNVATASTTYDGEEVKDSGEEEVPVDEVPSLEVTKTATQITRVNGDKVTIDDKTSEEDKKVSEGDKVTYTITVKNTGNVTLENIDVTDELKVEFDGKVVEPKTTLKTISSLAPNAKDTIYVTFEVTQDYIDKNGKIENVATATTTFEDEPVTDTDTDDTIPTNNTPSITLKKEATQIKAVESKDFENVEKDENENVTTYVENVGDTIKYTITVTNNGGKTLENVNVVDEDHNVKVLKIAKGTNVYQETGKEDDIAKGTNLLDFLPDTENKTLEPGESYVIEIEYVVESVNNVDNITNTAKVTATPKNETTPVEDKDTESLPVPEEPAASIEKTSVKVNTTTLTDEDRVNIKLHKDDVITYEIVVSNDGNKDLTDVVVTDDHKVTVKKVEKVNADDTRTLDKELTANADNDNLLGKTTLEAGEKYVITVTYVVPDNNIDESDKENGNKLTNIAKLSAKYKDTTITGSDYDTLTKAEKPIISQEKASTVIRDGKKQEESTIQKGDIIEYTITVKNEGNVSGETTVKDTMLKDNIASGKISMVENTINVTATRASEESKTSVAETTTVEELASEKGLEMTIDNGDIVTITFRVRVEKLLPGETIANELVGANTVENKGKEVKVEINQETVKPQETVIVIDLSRSMAQGVDFVNDDSEGDPFADTYGETRWVALKDALDTFLGNYMDGNNKVTIIGYSEEAETLISGTSNKSDAMDSYADVLKEDQFDKGKAKRDEEGGEDTVDNLEGTGSKLKSGTNVEAGLYLAEVTLEGKMNGANVILMTDGEANRYGHNEDVEKISSEDVSTGIGVIHAQDEAERMKDDGATLYTITLSMGDVNSSTYNELLAGLASEGKSASAENKDALKNIFEGISSIISGQHLVGTTEGGIVTLKEAIDIEDKTVGEVVVNIPNADGVGEIRLTWDEFDDYYDDREQTVDINSMIKGEASRITSVTGDIEITITINNAN